MKLVKYVQNTLSSQDKVFFVKCNTYIRKLCYNTFIGENYDKHKNH